MALGLLCLSASALKAQDAGSSAGQVWKDARAQFGSGDYTGCASNLEKIIKLSGVEAQWLNLQAIPPAPPKQQWLDPVFYLLGAARFNAKDWPEAIKTFNIYRQLFPKSPHTTEIIFSLAQAKLLGGDPNGSIPVFTSLLPVADYHPKAVMFLVEANKKADKPQDAITLLEKERADPEINPDFLERVNVLLAGLYLDAKDEDKVLAVLQEMDAHIDHIADIPQFNNVAVRLGDQFLAENRIDQALNCYRRVRNNEQIIALQKQQIAKLQAQRATNLVRIQANPLTSDQLQIDNKDIDVQIGKDEKILSQYQTLPPVLPPLFLRIGRAYSLAKEMWESAVVYREILRRYPTCKEAEAALYGSLVVFDQLKQIDRALALCETYLKQYPQGKYADSVGFLRGALAYDAENFDLAITFFEDSLKNQPNNPRREQIELILGDIKLRQGKFEDAITAYKRYLTDFPNGEQIEKAEYRSDLALLFSGNATDADAAFRAYLKKYPDGFYVADAEYRLDVIKFADKKYDEVIADGVAWQKKNGQSGPLAEMLSLMGDCYISEDKTDEAVDCYTRSFKAAQTAEVLNYSIFAAAKILNKQSKWADIVKMFQDFVKDNPDHPTVVSAIFWIGKSEIKLGKVDEAKHYLADTAKKYLNDPSREAVDEIITQLAQLYARKHLAVVQPPALTPVSGPTSAGTAATPAFTTVAGSPSPGNTSSAAVAAPVPSTITDTAPPPPASDPAKDLENILTIPDIGSQPTARARILYAKAELARLQRKPDVEEQILLEVAQQFKPEDLSPILLGQTGDCLVHNNQLTEAEPFFHHLVDDYDKSPLVDYGYNGLGQIAYQKKDYAQADRYFAKALDKGLAASKLKEITLGEALTLLALNRPDDAKPYFEQVASNRAWRGEATALSVFSLGEIQMRDGKFPEANAFFQRVFVAYQKYPAIQAKAYLHSGEAFEKLGKVVEAKNTYSEMLKNPNLSSFPEASEAQQRLQHLAAQ